MFIIMVGVPGSDKSHIARMIAESHDCEIVSSDECRKKWYGDEEDQTHNKELFLRIDALVSQLLDDGKNVILDATNISRKSRARFVAKKKKHKVDTIAVVVHTSPETAKERNATRSRTVPDFVIDRQINNFQMPTEEEGFDRVIVIDNENSDLTRQH